MATKLTKSVSRTVVDERGDALTVTLTVEGIVLRRPRSRAAFLLPFTAAETRAQMLEANRQRAVSLRNTPTVTRAKRVSRGLLSVEGR